MRGRRGLWKRGEVGEGQREEGLRMRELFKSEGVGNG